MILHKHHVLPRHAGGTNDKSNLLLCSVSVHAYLHRIRYITHGDEYDRIAYLGLEKTIGKDEMVTRSQKENAMRMIADPEHPFGSKENCSKGGRAANNWAANKLNTYGYIQGKKNVESGLLDRIRELTKEPVSMALKLRNKEKAKCPHCGKVGQNVAMQRWHFNNCKEITE
jgi:hypothetical protein